MKTALAFFLLASAAQAQDHIAAQGPLSDADFYRLVACAAPPDQPCQKPFVRWQVERPLKLWVAPLPEAYLGGKAKRAEAAINLAIKELNASGAAISLARTDIKTVADIQLFFLDQARGEPIQGTGHSWVDGARLGGATTRMQANVAKGEILAAAIVVSTTLGIASYEGVILEELTQALGLMTDIKSPAYVGVSVLSQDGNRVTRLGVQDKTALKQHYPPK